MSVTITLAPGVGDGMKLLVGGPQLSVENEPQGGTMKQTSTRTIHLESPLELTTMPTVTLPFPATYTVTAVQVHASGDLDAVAYDWIGCAVGPCVQRRELGREAVRVLGLSGAVDQAARPRRRSRLRGFIPEVWGLSLRPVGRAS